MEGGSFALLWYLLVASQFGLPSLTVVHAIGIGALLRVVGIIPQSNGWPTPSVEIEDYDDFALCVKHTFWRLFQMTALGVMVGLGLMLSR